MKKTLTINISGIVFHIDEDAYSKLDIYLKKLSKHYLVMSEGKEIIADIESRIAELFQQKLEHNGNVVTNDMVDYVISILGKVEELINDDDEQNFSEDSYTEKNEQKNKRIRRRLYRNPENRVLGGVAGGLAAYFDLDVVLIRALFVVLTLLGYGISLLIYIVLWIVTPKARTTSQKLEMKGKNVNISNIEESIKYDYNEVRNSFNDIKNNNNKTDKIISFTGLLFRFLLKLIIIIIGLGVIIFGFISLINFVASLFNSGLVFPNIHFNISPVIFENLNNPLIAVLFFFILAIPVLLCIFIITKIIFRYKSNNTLIIIGSLLVWFFSIIALTITLPTTFVSSVLTNKNNYITSFNKNHKTSVEYSSNKIISKDTLFITANKNKFDLSDYEKEGRKFINIEDNVPAVIGIPKLIVEKSYSDKIILTIRKKLKNSNWDRHKNKSDDIEYNYEIKDSLLVLNEVFIDYYGESEEHYVDIILKVPVGKYIVFEPETNRMLDEDFSIINTNDSITELNNEMRSVIDNYTVLNKSNIINNMLIMTENGLNLNKKRNGL